MFPVFDLNARFLNYGAVLRSRSRVFFWQEPKSNFPNFTTHSKSFEAYDEKNVERRVGADGFSKARSRPKKNLLRNTDLEMQLIWYLLLDI